MSAGLSTCPRDLHVYRAANDRRPRLSAVWPPCMGTKKNTTPLEDAEQMAFVDWLEGHELKFTAIPNNTYTTSWSQKRKNWLMGLRKGYPDMIVLVPPERSKDGEGYMLNIEMKRQEGSTMSKEQKEWAAALNGLGVANVQAYRANGFEEAKKIVRHYCDLTADSIF